MLSMFFIAFNLHLPFFPVCLINKIDEIDINQCQLMSTDRLILEMGDRAMTFITVIIRATIDFQ